jgi:hypothetical protein
MMNLRGCLFDALAAKERAEENELLAYQRKVDADADAEAVARKSRVRACCEPGLHSQGWGSRPPPGGCVCVIRWTVKKLIGQRGRQSFTLNTIPSLEPFDSLY